MSETSEPKDLWKNRRRFAYSSLVFMIVYAVIGPLWISDASYAVGMPAVAVFCTGNIVVYIGAAAYEHTRGVS